jgi:hypothetical protein
LCIVTNAGAVAVFSQNILQTTYFNVSRETNLVLFESPDAKLVSITPASGGYFSNLSTNGTVRYHPHILFSGADHFRARIEKDGKILPYSYQIDVEPATVETLMVTLLIEDTLKSDLKVHLVSSVSQGNQSFGTRERETTLINGAQVINQQILLRPGLRVSDIKDKTKYHLEVKGDFTSRPIKEITARIWSSVRSSDDFLLLADVSRSDSKRSPEGLVYEWEIPQPSFPDPPRPNTEVDDFGQGDTTYFISVGASFDLFDGASVDNVYSNVQAFMPRLWTFDMPVLKTPSGLGLDAGFAQRRTVEANNVSSRKDRYYDAKNQVITVDSIEAKTETKYDNISLFCNPTIYLTKGIYLFGNVEFRKTTRKSKTSFSVKSTASIPLSNQSDTAIVRNPVFQTDSTSQSSEDEVILGPGLLFEYEDDNIEFFLAPSYNFPYSKVPYNWLIEFKIRERHASISLGGEVRNFMGGDSQYLIYIAKEFPISFLADIFGMSKK